MGAIFISDLFRLKGGIIRGSLFLVILKFIHQNFLSLVRLVPCRAVLSNAQSVTHSWCFHSNPPEKSAHYFQCKFCLFCVFLLFLFTSRLISQYAIGLSRGQGTVLALLVETDINQNPQINMFSGILKTRTIELNLTPARFRRS